MTQPDIIYICKGEGAECYLQPGCTYREDPKATYDMECKHTLDPKMAKYGVCDNPEMVSEDRPSIFIFHELSEDCGPSYYWEVEKNEQCGTSD